MARTGVLSVPVTALKRGGYSSQNRFMIIVLPHAAIAVDRDRRHSCSSWMIEELAQSIKSLFGSWVKYPSTRSDDPDAPLFTFGEKRGCAGCQVEAFIVHFVESVSSTKGTGLLESTPRSEPQPPSSTFDFELPVFPRRTVAVFLVAASTSSRCAAAVRTIARMSTSRRPFSSNERRAVCASRSVTDGKVTSA
jgi:hypothetical protein